MPPRSVVAAILVFWLAADGWLFYREVWPYWRAGDPPPYTIDLTEELGDPTVNWDILKNKDPAPIGRAISQVKRQKDRTYRLRMEYRFDKFNLVFGHLRKLVGDYHVGEEGDLLGMMAEAYINTSGKLGDLDLVMAVKATVDNGELVPELFFDNEKLKLGDLRVPLADRAGAINPLHPVNRLPGLHAGRRWRIKLFDPLSAIAKGRSPQLRDILGAVEGAGIPELHAEVKTADLEWNGDEVPCYTIEYRKPGDVDPVATTWVRRRDGLVLQQHARQLVMEMTLRRKPAN
jgi:hypothetical protein